MSRIIWIHLQEKMIVSSAAVVIQNTGKHVQLLENDLFVPKEVNSIADQRGPACDAPIFQPI